MGVGHVEGQSLDSWEAFADHPTGLCDLFKVPGGVDGQIANPIQAGLGVDDVEESAAAGPLEGLLPVDHVSWTFYREPVHIVKYSSGLAIDEAIGQEEGKYGARAIVVFFLWRVTRERDSPIVSRLHVECEFPDV